MVARDNPIRAAFDGAFQDPDIGVILEDPQPQGEKKAPFTKSTQSLYISVTHAGPGRHILISL